MEDCVGRLRDLEAQGKVWGQDLLLGVRDQDLLLSDMESRVPRGDPQTHSPPPSAHPHVFQLPHEPFRPSRSPRSHSPYKLHTPINFTPL